MVRKSGFLDHLEEGDTVIADKGFNSQVILAVHGVRLIALPMMTKSKISVCASTSTRRIATSRVHIERINDKQAQDYRHFEKNPAINIYRIYRFNC